MKSIPKPRCILPPNKVMRSDKDYNRQRDKYDFEEDEMKRVLTVKWIIEDVKSIRPDLTHKQCSDVLLAAEEQHDANCGINWDFLQCIADELYPL